MSLNVDIQGNLLPNILTMATQLLATLIIFLLFKKFLWKPVREILNKRAESMQGELEEAKKLQEEANLHLEQAKLEIQEAKDSSKKIVEEARSEADNLKDSIIKDAEARAKVKIEEANETIERKKEDMRNELKDEIADVALLAAEKLLGEKVDEKKDREFINNFLNENK